MRCLVLLAERLARLLDGYASTSSAARLLLHPSQTRSSPSRRLAHKTEPRRRAHACFASRACPLLHLAECLARLLDGYASTSSAARLMLHPSQTRSSRPTTSTCRRVCCFPETDRLTAPVARRLSLVVHDFTTADAGQPPPASARTAFSSAALLFVPNSSIVPIIRERPGGNADA